MVLPVGEVQLNKKQVTSINGLRRERMKRNIADTYNHANVLVCFPTFLYLKFIMALNKSNWHSYTKVV